MTVVLHTDLLQKLLSQVRNDDRMILVPARRVPGVSGFLVQLLSVESSMQELSGEQLRVAAGGGLFVDLEHDLRDKTGLEKHFSVSSDTRDRSRQSCRALRILNHPVPQRYPNADDNLLKDLKNATASFPDSAVDVLHALVRLDTSMTV